MDGLDLEVAEGEIFGLLGPNGAGKTTTVGHAHHARDPDRGHGAASRGVDVVAHPSEAKRHDRRRLRRRTRWTAASPSGRTSTSTAATSGWAPSESRRIATELLEVFRLTDRADADVETLSGGMAQRLMVARSIVHRPRILFLDEPTSGLDPQSRIALWEIVREIHADGSDRRAHHALHGGGRPAVRAARHHGPRARSWRSTPPTALKRTVGGDTIVRVTAEGDPDGLAEPLRGLEGVTDAQVMDGAVQLTATGAEGLLPRVWPRGRGRRARGPRPVASTNRRWRRSSSTSPERTFANERPTTTDTPTTLPRVAPQRSTPADRVRRAAAARPARSCARRHRVRRCARSCSRCCSCSCSPTSSRRSGRGSAARRARGHVLEPARARRRRDRLHLPGHPGRGAPARARVRLQPRDRGPRDGAPAGVGGRAWRSCWRARSRALLAAAHRVPAGRHRARPRRSTWTCSWLELLTLLPLAASWGRRSAW